MKFSTAPSRAPQIVEDPDGDVVLVEQLDDRDLFAMLNDTETIIAVIADGTPTNGPEQQIVGILDGYRTNALQPHYESDEVGDEHDVRLIELRRQLQQKSRWLLAGCAMRPTRAGDEAVAVVAFASRPYRYCEVVVSLDEEEEMLAA